MQKNLTRLLVAKKYYQIYLAPYSLISGYSKPRIITLNEKPNQLLAINNSSLISCIQTRNAIKGAGYTNFGHSKDNQPRSSNASMYYLIFMGCGFFMALSFNWWPLLFGASHDSKDNEEFQLAYTRSGDKSIKAASKEENESNDENEKKIEKKAKKSKKAAKTEHDEISKEEKDEIEEVDDGDEKPKNKKVTFKDRRIIEYENRIREYSTPDKIFRYFATLKVLNEATGEYEIFMKPEDFLRSLTFGDKQPEGLGLDSFQRYEPNMHNLEINVPENSVFYHLGQQGLISFSDYIFLLTLLSIPARHFEIAFKMWDLDGSGNIDISEFEELQAIIRNSTTTGLKHRDTRMTGSVLKENSALNKFFFGEDFKGTLTVEKFTQFQKQLQSEMIRMEFERFNPVDGKISEFDFSKSLLAYAGFGDAKTRKMLKRVSKKATSNEGITFTDFENFFHVLRSIQDIDTTLKFYALAGASIDQTIFKHVAKTVANVTLNDHLVDVVFRLFDDNGDGKLSHHEFILVMKKRWSRGLQNPKDTGFVKFISAFYTCGKETARNRYF